MAEYYIEHYGYVDDGHSLAHYGVRGMRWRQHKYTGNSSRDYDYSTGDRSRANYYNVQGQIADTKRFHAQRDPQRIINTRRQNEQHKKKINKLVNTGDAARAAYYRNQGENNVNVVRENYENYRNRQNENRSNHGANRRLEQQMMERWLKKRQDRQDARNDAVAAALRSESTADRYIRQNIVQPREHSRELGWANINAEVARRQRDRRNKKKH